MKVISGIAELKKELNPYYSANNSIGLVPTMGALHKGHLSLVEEAEKGDDIIVVSVFVNPTQFNDPADLERYPRTLNKDLELLSKHEVDIVFAPSVEEMYPDVDTRIFDLAPLDSVMEGKYRPGHFNGVAQIVSKLFEVVSPDRAYFGQKDFQQVAIIKKMVSLMKSDIEIITCPIIRESDGLAMSSRNQLLNTEERNAAPLINKVLQESTEMVGLKEPEEVKKYVTEKINTHPLMKLDYFEIVDIQSLMPIQRWGDSDNKIGCIAVHLGNVRLIDNRFFH